MCQHYKKQLFVFILSLLLLGQNLFIPTGYAINQTGGVDAKLKQVLSEYPAGSYFSVNGKACPKESGDECPNCNILNILKAKGIIIPGQGSAWTCFGFATYVYYSVFNQGMNRHRNMTLVASGDIDTPSTFSKALPGDIVLFYGSNKSSDRSYSHTAVFVGSTKKGVILYDSNIGETNKVHYGEVLYKNIIKSYTSKKYGERTYCKIYHANNYNEVDASSGGGLPLLHTITFNPNGGVVTPNTKTVTEGSTIGPMPTPTRDGYTFIGWSTEQNGSGMVLRTGEELFVEKDTTLYALWKENTIHKDHTYVDDKCSVCGAILSSDNGFDSSTAGKYLVIANTAYIRTGPYQSKTEVYRLNRWDEIEVVGSVVNSYGNTWLKTSDGYYTHAEKLEPVIEQVEQRTEISFNNLSTPGNLTVGNGGHIDGSITSSNSPICSVKAEVLDGNGRVRLTASSSGFSVTTYGPLKNSKIDRDLTFGKLPVGDYYIKYTATTKDNTTASAQTSVFHVKASATSQTVSPTTPVTPLRWGPWSEWSSTRYYSSDTREVETRQVKVSDGYTEYRYGRYIDGTGGHAAWCADYLASRGYSEITAQYTGWSTSRYNTSGKGWTCGSCGGNHVGVDHYGSDGRAWWAEYVSPRSGSFFWEERRQSDATYETQYRYRDLISG